MIVCYYWFGLHYAIIEGHKFLETRVSANLLKIWNYLGELRMKCCWCDSFECIGNCTLWTGPSTGQNECEIDCPIRLFHAHHSERTHLKTNRRKSIAKMLGSGILTIFGRDYLARCG